MNTKAILVSLVVVIIILQNVIVFQVRKISRLKEERKQVIDFSNSQKQQLTYYQNKLERETAKVGVLNLTLNSARDLINNERLAFVQQFNGVNKRLNNLEQVSRTTALVVSEWRIPLRDTVLVNIDSTLTTARVFSYADSLNRVSGIIVGDQITPKIEIMVPLQGVVYWERRKILGLRIGRKKWFSDITSTNPAVKIKEHEVIKVTKR
jgi:hypothetical protein